MFDQDMAEIGLIPVDVAPRATEHVEEMVDWITHWSMAVMRTSATAGSSSIPGSTPTTDG